MFNVLACIGKRDMISYLFFFERVLTRFSSQCSTHYDLQKGDEEHLLSIAVYGKM
jgi:hypothetical protein